MPSTSGKQHRFMAAVANNPAFAKKAGVPASVGKDFVQADKGRKFAEGGYMKESKEMQKREIAFMKKKGAPKSMIKHEQKEAKGDKYAGGGEMLSRPMPIKQMPMPNPPTKRVGLNPIRTNKPPERVPVPTKPMPKGPGGANPPQIHPKAPRPGGSVTTQPYNNTLLAKGGFTRAADGIAKKGKTQAAQIKMSKGGKCK